MVQNSMLEKQSNLQTEFISIFQHLDSALDSTVLDINNAPEHIKATAVTAITSLRDLYRQLSGYVA